MAVNLTPTQEKVFKYLLGRKTWATVKQVCTVLNLGSTNASIQLSSLVKLEIVDEVQIGRNKVYKIKD